MSDDQPRDQDAVEQDEDRQAEAMKDQLRKDVAAWSADREGRSAHQTEATPPPVPGQRPVLPARKAKPTATPKVAAPKPAGPKTPFTMSYGNVSQADYIEEVIARRLK